MKNYKELLRELPSKSVVFTCGRFNPPNVGHELEIKVVRKLASQRKADHFIFVSSIQDAKKNPLEIGKKLQYLGSLFPNTKFVHKEIDAIGTILNKYKSVTLVTPADSVEYYKKALKKIGITDVEIVKAVDTCPDEDDKLIKLASKGDYVSFKHNLPTTVRDLDGKRLMNDVRSGLGLEPIKEEINLVKDELREQYFRGEVFNEGDIVESDNTVYKIIKRGSNHLLLQSEEGSKVSKWIQDVQLTEREFMLDEKQLQEADSTSASGATGLAAGAAAKEAKKAQLEGEKAKLAAQYAETKKKDAENYAKAQASLKQSQHNECTDSPVVNKNSKYNIAKSIMSLSDFRKSTGQMTKDETEIADKVHDGLVGNTHMGDSHGLRHMKVKHHLGEASAAAKLQKAFQREQERIAAERKAGEELLKKPVKEEVDLEEGYFVHREKDTKLHFNTVAQLRQSKTPSHLKVTDHKHKHLGTVADVLRNQTLYKTEETVVEGNGYDDNRTGFSKKPREDDEYHNEPKPKFKAKSTMDRPHTVHIDGKPWKKFDNGHQAHAAAKTLQAKGKKATAIAHFREETEEQQGTRAAQLKRFKDQAKDCKLSEEQVEEAVKPKVKTVNVDKVHTAGQEPHEEKFETVKEGSEFDFEEISESEFDALIESLTDEDMLEVYEDSELAIIDEETGEEIEALDSVTEEALMEVLSRMERIKAKARMRRSAAKRERAEKIALRQFSSSSVANRRARRLSVSVLKKRLMKGVSPSKASVGQKENMERYIAQHKKVVDRLSARMVTKVRQTEKKRLSHRKFTKG